MSFQIFERGKPVMTVSDNGTEFASNAVLAWCGEIRLEWYSIAFTHNKAAGL